VSVDVLCWLVNADGSDW